MPKEMIHTDGPFVPKVGWAQDQGVQLGLETSDGRSLPWTLYGSDDDPHESIRRLESIGQVVLDFLAAPSAAQVGTVAEIAFGAASNKVSLYMCMQRPTGMERVTWSSVSDAYIFKCGIIDDIRELAALGTVDPKDAVVAIRTKIRGHKFLHLPTRGQSAGWSISEVDPRVI